MIIFYCFHSCTFIVIFIIFCANCLANRTLELSPLVEQDNMERHGVLPPIPNQYFDSTEKLRREYHLEDFLWAGSGDGPSQSDGDGGLAWEGGGDTDVIRVTKTMLLFKTVLTTIYPIEMTPSVQTLIIPSVSPTPSLTSIPSLMTSATWPPEYLDSSGMSPTQTFTFVEPTASLPHGSNGHEDDKHIKDMNEAASDRLYWVQTVIKANGSVIMSQQPSFQGEMQKHLARIYASAFKRHLMQSLGVLDTNKIQNQHKLRRRRKRSNSLTSTLQQHEEGAEEEDLDSNKSVQLFFQPASSRGDGGGETETREDFDTDWFYLGQHLTPSRMRSLATTAMNVTVSILNISQVDKFPHVSLNYIVCAEGNPIPAASAVQDLSLVTKQEMEKEIGYEVINKAEALVASPLQETKVEIATSPWLVVAIISICVMALLVLVIMYMVFTKWKNNRLSDTIISPTRPQSGIEEGGGIVNPAFAGPASPTGPLEVRTRPSKIPKSSTYTSHKLVDESTSSSRPPSHSIILPGAPRRTQQIAQHQQALASELNILLNQRDDGQQLSPSSIKSGSSSSAKSSTKGEDAESKPVKSSTKSRKATERVQSSIKFKSKRTPSPRKKVVAGVKKRGDSSSQEIRRRKKIEGDDQDEQNAPEGEKSKSKSSGASTDLKGSRPSRDGPGSSRGKKKPSSSVSELEQVGKFPGRLTIPSLDQHLQERETTSRSMDKISYGNLDICQDSIARPISAKAKKLLPKGHYQPMIQQGSGSIGGDGTSISSGVLMEHEWADNQENLASAKETQKTIDKLSDLETEEDDEEMRSSHEQDRDLSESFERLDSTEAEPPTKDVEVQTPTRRWKGAKGPVPKSRKKRVDQLSSESLISTESEEVIEVHNLGDSSGDINPLGKMRKRFHQFLDDAFNIMGKKEGEDEAGRSKSAKVSISHHIETRETNRPWTSHLVREDSETLHRLRPKSASFGPPKRAWAAGSEKRRCHSAKSNTGSFKGGGGGGGVHGGRNNSTIFERGDENESEGEECDVSSTAVPASEPMPIHHHRGTTASNLCTEPIFPHYPIYADIPILTSNNPQQSTSDHRPRDPAVPLILAIKEEIKRFEKVKVAEKSPSTSSEP